MLSPGLEQGQGSGCHGEGEALEGSFLSPESSECWMPFHLVVYSHPCKVSRIFAWEAAMRVWLAADVHCLALWLVLNGGCGFGLVQGLKHLSQGSF